MNSRQMKMMGAAVGVLLSASDAMGGLSAEGYDAYLRNGDRSVLVWHESGEGYDAYLRNGDRSVLVWHESGEVRVTEPCAVELLLVGGGGGGGSSEGTSDQSASAGGGGAGGFVYRASFELAVGTYAISVGAGGEVDACGGDTTAFGLTAYGGGNGGGFARNPSPGHGGSGGGATTTWNGRDSLASGGEPVDSEQGTRGGAVIGFYSAGGGGGAGGAGGDADAGGTAYVMTAGGTGRLCEISGSETWYAGGGGGYRRWDSVAKGPVKAAGGIGGGGMDGEAGMDGLGGGGGGNARGGSGVVIVRYKKSPCGVAVLIR